MIQSPETIHCPDPATKAPGRVPQTMTTATPRRSLPSSSQAGKDKDFFLISQARNAHPCITPSPKPTPSIVKSFSLYNRRPSGFQHRQDKKRRFYGPRSISDGTPVRAGAAKAKASTSSSSGSTKATLPRTHDTSTSRDTQSLDFASLHDNPVVPATAVTVNNRNSAPTTTQPAINLTSSSSSPTPATMPPTPTVAPGGTHSPSSTLPSIQRTPSRFFVHHPLSTTIDNTTTTTTTMPPTSSSPPSSSPLKPTTTSTNSLSTVLHHSPGNISRRNAVHGRPAVPAFATVSSAMLVPEPLRIDVPGAHRAVRRQGIATPPPPVSPPPRLRPQMQRQQQQQPSSMGAGTTGGSSSSMAFTASTQATTASSSSWSSSSAAVSSSGEATVGVEKSQAAYTPRRLLFPPLTQRRAKREGLRGGGGGGGTYPFSSSSFLGASSAVRDGKGGSSGGEGAVVRRKPVSATGCAPVLHEKKAVGEKEKKEKKEKALTSSKGGKGVGGDGARGDSSTVDDDDVGRGGSSGDDYSYPEELEKLEREILALLFPSPGQQRYSSSSMSSSSERKLHELGGGAAASAISSGCSDAYHGCYYDGYMLGSNGTTAPLDRANPQNNHSGLRTTSGPFPTAPPPLLDPRDEAQMYALMLEEEQSEPLDTTSIPTSDSYTRLNQTGWQSKLARKKSGGEQQQDDDENQTLRQIIRQQRHHHHQQQPAPPAPPTPPSPQLLPLPSPTPSPPPLLPHRYRRNVTRQSSGPPPAMRLPDPPVRLPLQRLHRSRL